MTTFDRYAVVFLLAFALANVTWGIRNLYETRETTAVIERLEKSEECWKDKYQASRFGWHIEKEC